MVSFGENSFAVHHSSTQPMTNSYQLAMMMYLVKHRLIPDVGGDLNITQAKAWEWINDTKEHNNHSDDVVADYCSAGTRRC